MKTSKQQLLKNFMQEFFPFSQLLKAGFFTKEMKGNYEAQAKRVCGYFGFKTVYEYGARDIRCHITFAGERPEGEPFITEIQNIYES